MLTQTRPTTRSAVPDPDALLFRPSVVTPSLRRKEASNPVIQRGRGFLSQVLKINVIQYLYQNDSFNPTSSAAATEGGKQEIVARYSKDPVVHDGILKVFDGFYYNDLSHIADVMYANEVYTFNALTDLQGVCIPRLIDYGCFFTSGGLEDGLIREGGHVLDGPYTISENVGSLKVDTTSMKQYEAALHTLQMIHGMRVVHGDVRVQNMILQLDGRIMFIDFGHSQAFDTEDEELEMYKFQDLLKLKKVFEAAF